MSTGPPTERSFTSVIACAELDGTIKCIVMSDETRLPYQYLGERLKKLRESNNESLAEVSGAVEISLGDLEQFEAGADRPSEDILLLLFSHFDIESTNAAELWKLAGYKGHPEGVEEPENMNITSHQAMMVMVDPRIMYSDGVEVVAGTRGVVVNFSQVNGPDGKPLTISRIGMSRVQAEQLMGILHQVLYDIDNPSNKQLGSGPDTDKS